MKNINKEKMNKMKEKKYYLANGKEVKVGDIISMVKKINSPIFGVGRITEEIMVSEEALPILIQEGIITTKESPNKNKVDANPSKVNSPVPMDIVYYMKKIGNRLGWKVDKVAHYLDSIASLNPTASLSIILKEIAIELDKRYDGHIRSAATIYCISAATKDNPIVEVPRYPNLNYKAISLFRSIEDAEIAKEIVKDFLDAINSESK